MKTSWVPVFFVRQNILRFLCLGLLGITTPAIENSADSLTMSNNRQQFPKHTSADQHRQDHRNQFPIQRRGSGTHLQIQIPTLDT